MSKPEGTVWTDTPEDNFVFMLDGELMDPDGKVSKDERTELEELDRQRDADFAPIDIDPETI